MSWSSTTPPTFRVTAESFYQDVFDDGTAAVLVKVACCVGDLMRSHRDTCTDVMHIIMCLVEFSILASRQRAACRFLLVIDVDSI